MFKVHFFLLCACVFRWLGKPVPTRAQLNTASLGKYYQMIQAWGGWDLFQELLRALRVVADKHRTSIAVVGVRWVLQQPAVVSLGASARLVVPSNGRPASWIRFAHGAHVVRLA